MAKSNNLAELFKYCSPDSIMVVTWYGKLKTLHCPFTVKVSQSVGKLTKGNYQKVEEVKLATNGKTIFIIKEKPYYYHYFDILTHL
ncbi:hypothetical protein EVU94_00850 [Flavobacteriaceae bacterium 144Ye]|nr:hypothetical protein EVU94_00850 [Flavobacteriaceae bacterium 144Ye]